MTAASTTDVLFVIALDEEFAIMRQLLHEDPIEPDAHQCCYRFALQTVPHQHLRCAAWIAKTMGPKPVLSSLADVIDEARPKLVINLGIAGFMHSDVPIGSVLIADPILDYLQGGAFTDIISDEETLKDKLSFAPAPEPYRSTDRIIQIANRLTAPESPNLDTLRTESGRFFAEHFNLGKIRAEDVRKLLKDDVVIKVRSLISGPFVVKSAVFREILSKVDRTAAGVEMEAAAVAHILRKKFPELDFIAIKGISDPASTEKALIDEACNGKNRAWAMQNATRVAFAFLRQWSQVRVSSSDEAERELSFLPTATALHRVIATYYLPPPYRSLSNDATRMTQLQKASAAFSISYEGERTQSLDRIVNHLTTAPRGARFGLQGAPGIGKTTLISLVYLKLRQSHLEDPRRPFPLLISLTPNLGYFDAENEARFIDQDRLPSRVDSLLRVIRDAHDTFLNDFIILLDAGDSPTNAYKLVAEKLRDLIGTRTQAVLASGRTNHKRFDLNVRESFELHPISTNDSELLPFIRAFFSLAGQAETPDRLGEMAQMLKSTGRNTTDLLDASICLQVLDANRRYGNRGLNEVMERFVNARLIQQGVPDHGVKAVIREACELATADYLANDRSVVEKKTSMPARSLVSSHTRVRDYLLASAIIDDLMHVAEQSTNAEFHIPSRLNTVYPHRITRFCRAMLTNEDTQRQCILAAKKILNGSAASWQCRALVAYLVGRLSSEKWKPHAKDLVRKLRHEADRLHEQGIKSGNHRAELLFARTVYITLACLGDSDACTTYVENVLIQPRLDLINRGFHLEYYGDIEIAADFPLQHEDTLQEWQLTFDQLCARLRADKTSPLFDVELQTICSLAMHRHERGKLAEEKRTAMLALIKNPKVRDAVTSEQLAEWLASVELCLSVQHPLGRSVLRRLDAIKHLPRTGWLDRGIQHPESVAAHMYGAYLLGLLLLPETSEENGYKKETILKMLLIHDLAECVVGDKTPKQKNPDVEAAELRVFIQLKGLSILPGHGSLQEIANLYQEFKKEQSINARIAKEIDRLENLVQLKDYVADGHSIHDEATWEAGLRDAVKTPIGKQILHTLFP